MSTKTEHTPKVIQGPQGQEDIQYVVRRKSTQSNPPKSKRKHSFNHNSSQHGKKIKTNSTKKELRQKRRLQDSIDQDSCVPSFAQIAGPDELPNSAQISAREQEVAPATPPPSQESPGGPDRNAPFFTPGELTDQAGCNSSDQEDDQYVMYPASLAGEKPCDMEAKRRYRMSSSAMPSFKIPPVDGETNIPKLQQQFAGWLSALEPT